MIQNAPLMKRSVFLYKNLRKYFYITLYPMGKIW